MGGIFTGAYESVHDLQCTGEITPQNPFAILALGVAIGALAAAFIVITGYFAARLNAVPVWLRLTFAVALTGLLALPVPEIMSIGYDTVNAALLGQMAIVALVGIASSARS